MPTELRQLPVHYLLKSPAKQKTDLLGGAVLVELADVAAFTVTLLAVAVLPFFPAVFVSLYKSATVHSSFLFVAHRFPAQISFLGARPGVG